MDKMYDLGLVLGRFQMLHNGHCDIIKNALALCNRVVVFVGSSQEEGTPKNPFGFIIRKQMISKCFEEEYRTGKLFILGLPDTNVGNNSQWGKYVLDEFEKHFGRKPDLYITGAEKERASWFAERDAPDMSELRISRTVNKVTATEVRDALLKGDYDFVKIHTDYHLWPDLYRYEKLLEEVKNKCWVQI